MLASMAVLLALIAPGAAETQNGILENQFDYIEVHDGGCLGEGIEHHMTITRRSHSIERPNGGVHVVENWFLEGITIGLDSGLTWYTEHAPSPWVINANDAQTNDGFILQVPWQPLDGGRRFKETWRFRFVTDGNGELRVYYNEFELRCIGR
jgi:hypothetical protein